MPFCPAIFSKASSAQILRLHAQTYAPSIATQHVQSIAPATDKTTRCESLAPVTAKCNSHELPRLTQNCRRCESLALATKSEPAICPDPGIAPVAQNIACEVTRRKTELASKLNYRFSSGPSHGEPLAISRLHLLMTCNYS